MPTFPPTPLPTSIPASPTSILENTPITALPTNNPTVPTITTEPTSIPTDQPTTVAPINFPTINPTTVAPTSSPKDIPTTASPTLIPTTVPTTALPTDNPTNQPTTAAPTFLPTDILTTASPTIAPTTALPTDNPTTVAPTKIPTPNPTTAAPTSIPTANPTAALPEITGAFEVSLIGRFDNFAGFSWQRLFDFGNGPKLDNVLLGQRGNSNDMVLYVFKGNTYNVLVAAGAIINGETVTWQTGVETDGRMWILKNGKLLAEKIGFVPNNVTRSNKFIGKSNWAEDDDLRGSVENFQLVNK